MLLWISSKRCKHQRPLRHWKSPMSCQTVKWSLLATRDSDAPKHSSNHRSSALRSPESTRPHTTRSWNAILTSVKTCTRILFYPAVLLCIQVLPIVCMTRFRNWPHKPWRLRLLRHQNESTRSGLVARFWRRYPLSNRCGSPRLSMTRPVHRLFTENASKIRLIHIATLIVFLIFVHDFIYILNWMYFLIKLNTRF